MLTGRNPSWTPFGSVRLLLTKTPWRRTPPCHATSRPRAPATAGASPPLPRPSSRSPSRTTDAATPSLPKSRRSAVQRVGPPSSSALSRCPLLSCTTEPTTDRGASSSPLREALLVAHTCRNLRFSATRDNFSNVVCPRPGVVVLDMRMHQDGGASSSVVVAANALANSTLTIASAVFCAVMMSSGLRCVTLAVLCSCEWAKRHAAAAVDIRSSAFA